MRREDGKHLRSRPRRQRGLGLSEYLIIAALVAVAIVTAIAFFSDPIHVTPLEPAAEENRAKRH